MSFGLPIAPSFGYGVTDSIKISLRRAREALERVAAGMAGFVEPRIALAIISAAKDPVNRMAGDGEWPAKRPKA